MHTPMKDFKSLDNLATQISSIGMHSKEMTLTIDRRLTSLKK